MIINMGHCCTLILSVAQQNLSSNSQKQYQRATDLMSNPGGLFPGQKSSIQRFPHFLPQFFCIRSAVFIFQPNYSSVWQAETERGLRLINQCRQGGEGKVERRAQQQHEQIKGRDRDMF